MQKFVNLVDLVKSFPTSIYLQRFVSIQPRTSLSKFAKNSPKVRKKIRNILGLGMGANTKAAIVRMGLKEMEAFIKHFYPETSSHVFSESCGVRLAAQF